MDTTRGKHIVIDCWDVPKETLNNIEKITNVLLQAARSAGVMILNHYFHQFKPEGVSGYVLIAESHISIHTWPAQGYASIDIYTCGDKSFPYEALGVLKLALGSRRMCVCDIDRGLETQKMEIKEDVLENA